jgi:hypothetical protein
MQMTCLFRTTKPASPKCDNTQLPLGLAGFRKKEVEVVDNDGDIILKRQGSGRNTKGPSLATNLREHEQITQINSADEATQNQDYYFLLPENASEEEISNLFQAAKLHKAGGRKFNPWICYSLDTDTLEGSCFKVQRDNAEHYTIFPETECSCDQQYGEDEPRYVNNQLLGCGGWKPHCILMRMHARSVFLDYDDHFDEDLWKACEVIYENMMRSFIDDERDFLTLREILDFFQSHDYLWIVSKLNNDVLKSWSVVLSHLMDHVCDEDEFLILRTMNRKLCDLEEIKIESLIVILYGVNFDEEKQKNAARLLERKSNIEI